MNILVTGGAGFIGSHLVEKLLHEGHVVTVLDDLSTGKRENLPRHDRLELVLGDVADPDLMGRAAQGQDAIFHLAAIASVQASIDDPLTTNRTNLQGTIAVLEAARKTGARRVVFASSAAVYGSVAELPVTEDAPVNPMSPYAADKLAGEHYLAHYHRQGWIDGSALRFFNVFGPRQDPSSPYSGVISIFAERASRGEGVTIYGDGQQTRDFVFVSDLVAVLHHSLSWPREEQVDIVNLGRARQTSLVELLDSIERILGSSVSRERKPVRPGDIRHSLADTRRLRERMPEFAPRELDEGLFALLETVPDRA